MTGRELRALRKGLGLSQTALGEALGYTQVHVSQMETGKAPVTIRAEKAVLLLAERDALLSIAKAKGQ